MNHEDIRALVRANPPTATGYPQHVRDVIVDHARRRREEGARWADIEREVGVSSTSMINWMRPRKSGFHQVAIVDEPAVVEVVDEPVVITSPTGFTLTGLTLDQAVTVMQRLR